ncbi:MAG TPA: rhodanese-like domain-containing protein [Planctomycetota bacterium]|jgi:rhodanese-related sulfurtransferase|nr:rhodanese-like domain-containing protein [Planctomycetota bacterium]
MLMHEKELGLQRHWFEAKLASEMPKISVVAKVKEGKGDFVIVDARDRASYDKEHLPGAISMPLGEVDEEFGYLDPSKVHVTYCWNAT